MRGGGEGGGGGTIRVPRGLCVTIITISSSPSWMLSKVLEWNIAFNLLYKIGVVTYIAPPLLTASNIASHNTHVSNIASTHNTHKGSTIKV